MALQKITWFKRDNLGRKRQQDVIIEVKDGRIWFVKSDFCFKDAIKAMRGAKWHGFDEDKPLKVWSVEDCHRNWQSIRFMAGENTYAHFDQPIQHFEYARPLMQHQRDLADGGLTYHYQIFAAEMGLGKTLAAQEVIERSGQIEWWWVGPKTSLQNIQREFLIWGFPVDRIRVEFMTFDGLVRRMDEWKPGDFLPNGVIFDESSKLKTWTTQRTKAAARLADLIREKYGVTDGYVILMSGSPSPKSPVDWWAQAEIAWPGFLAEGSDKAFRERLAFTSPHTFESGVTIKKLEGWRDDELKCKQCGEYEDHQNHHMDQCADPTDYHPWEKSINEVALVEKRLNGLAIVRHKKDCLDLPEKRYRRVYCKPSASIVRVAQAIAQSAQNALTGATLLRELSDGFQYYEVKEGTTRCTHCVEGKVSEWSDPENPTCTYRSIDLLQDDIAARLRKTEVVCPACRGTCEVPKFVKKTREVPCPKDAALKELLAENDEQGRIVIFAGFTAAVDRCVRLCQEEGWDVVRCDGTAFQAITHENKIVTDEKPLDYWADTVKHPRVAWVAHPESGGSSFTLTESRMAVYWSNTYKPESRTQSEDRIHRIGADMNRGVLIVDLIHLPSDEKVLEVIKENRRLELLTMGEVMGDIDWENPKGVEDGVVTVDVVV
jgi:hypothetical protein